MSYKCCACGKIFTRPDNLRRHQKTSCKLRKPPLQCEQPLSKRAKTTAWGSSADISVQPCTSDAVLCDVCGIHVPKHALSGHLRCLQHKEKCCVNISDNVQILKSAFNRRVATYRIWPKQYHIDYDGFFKEIEENVLKLLSQQQQKLNSVKINLELFALFVHIRTGEMDIKSFNSRNVILNESSDIPAVFHHFIDGLKTKAQEFQERDSGWTLVNIEFLEANFAKFNPLRASSFVKTPKNIAWKKAIVNVRNYDDCCFAWSIVSALYQPSGNPCRTSSYPHFAAVLNVQGIFFPMKLKQIPLFEELNNISVNVYAVENSFCDGKCVTEIVGPLYYSENIKQKHVNLLILADENGNQHYTWIKNLSRLVSSQINKNEHEKFFCDGCFQYFTKYRKLLEHKSNDCNHIYTVTPTTKFRIDKRGNAVPENILKFENYSRQIEAPFVIYADFESILKPILTCIPKEGVEPFTVDIHQHIPYSFGFYLKCSFNDSLSRLNIYRGENCVQKFVLDLEKLIVDLYHNHLKINTPIDSLTEQQEIEFQDCSQCHICNGEILENEGKVRDHCHVTGRYRGAAHSICNLNYQLPNFIPVVFHNLSGYDAHLFVKTLCSLGSKINVIAVNKEKYITFSKSINVENKVENGKIKKVFLKLRFIDSYRFLESSLENLANKLQDDDLKNVRKFFPNDEEFYLMRKKGVFPYTYLDSFQKLMDTKLPPIEIFSDEITKSYISETDYKHAQRIWNLFKCKTLGEYSDLYLKADVLLLADIFENFRQICRKTYSLDPCQYVTAPSLSWDSFLRYTKIELELLNDIAMVQFLKRGIRGGICQCVERKHIANNKYLADFNPNERSSFIMYFDATNLYGYAMNQKLPVSNFEWMPDSEIETFDLMKVGPNSTFGYILEVDVEYPKSLHKIHADLPFLPENMIPPSNESRQTKLLTTLYNKMKYISHYLNLTQAVLNGLKITKIHRILKFKQEAFMKPYIWLNTEMRNNSSSKSDKDFYKKMVNSIFGKTLENVDKRSDIRISTHWANIGKSLGAEALIARPSFKNFSIFSKDCVAIQMEKLKVVYNKPIYLGFTILELSKIVLYGFYYNFCKKEFGDRVSLLYMDTDSLVLKIYHDDFYSEIRKHLTKFDTSNYPENNIYNIPRTMSVVGKMKDEFAGIPIKSFYGTGAKAYCVKLENKQIVKKAKGIKRSVIHTELNESHYLSVVDEEKQIMKKMSVFSSRLHQMYTQLKYKVALSPRDDKRFIIPGTVRTLAWGHEDIALHQLIKYVNEDEKKSSAEHEKMLIDKLTSLYETHKVPENYLNEIYNMLCNDNS